MREMGSNAHINQKLLSIMTTMNFQTGNESFPVLTLAYGRGRESWEIRSNILTYKGYSYSITGYKGHNGFYVNMKRVNVSADGKGFSYLMFGSVDYNLVPSERVTVTEKFVKGACERAAAAFSTLLSILPEKVIIPKGAAYTPEYGDTVLYFYKENELNQGVAIYEIDGEVRTCDLNSGHVRDESKDSAEEVDRLLAIQAEAAQAAHEKRKEADRIAEVAKAEAKRVFDEFKPSWAQAAIVAQFQVDKSDPMSDLFDFRTERQVVIGWSANARNDFNEMRNCAALFPETEHLKYDIEKLENRENWANGYGYFLGESKYHGWIIKKHELHSAWGTYEIAEHLKKEQPAQQDQAEGSNIARIAHNEAQGGVEIYFASKPSPDVLSEIRGNSFRWSMRNKCWYRKISPYAIKMAAKFGKVPESLLEPAYGPEN